MKKACNRLDKRRQWLEDPDIESAQPESWRKKVPTTSEPNKLATDFDKKAMEESIIEELCKKFEAVSLANVGQRNQERKDGYRCVWCDSLEHQRRECADLQEAIRRNVVYLDGYKICSNESRKPLRVNFGSGGMKKIVEEEDAKHVVAMHYAATAGIRVRRENLKLIETRGGFWPTVFEFEKKGKFGSKDLQLAGGNVKRVTGWSDPVDNNTSFAEVICDNYEVLVEERRKRMGEEDGVLKRPNMRSGRKDEPIRLAARKEVGETSGNPSGTPQPAQMEVDDSAKKGKERTTPTYRLKLDIEQVTDL